MKLPQKWLWLERFELQFAYFLTTTFVLSFCLPPLAAMPRFILLAAQSCPVLCCSKENKTTTKDVRLQVKIGL